MTTITITKTTMTTTTTTTDDNNNNNETDNDDDDDEIYMACVGSWTNAGRSLFSDVEHAAS